MNYPLISEYTEAILSAEDNFNELTNLRPVLDSCGRPIMSSGNFAVVYKMRDIETGKFYAVKCFTREQEGRADAYEKISNYLRDVHADFIVDVKYYPYEFFVDNSQSDETEFPVLLMDWIDGIVLEEYISINSNNSDKLISLSSKFIDLIGSLLSKHFAHGDLKPDNIIIDNEDNIKLIDYDGMFVPSMEGQISPELGTPKFQFRHREPNDFNEYIDDYGALYLALIIRLLAVSDRSYDTLMLLDVPQLITVASKHVKDTVLSKILSSFILAYNRGFIEREVLSVCLYNENKYDRDKELSYLSRARKGDTSAMIALGDTYSRGTFTPKNASKAIDWYYLARAMGDINAACGVCRHYYHFDNDFFNYSLENPIQRELLNQSKDFAICREGEYHLMIDRDYALRALREAEQMNYSPSQNFLNSDFASKLVSTIASPEEDTILDEFNAGKYSIDGKKLIKYTKLYTVEYEVKEGTETLCDNCFNDLYSECDISYLQKLILPATLRRIGNNAFCASIEQIECKSKWFIIKNDMLFSKDGKILYRYFGNDKKIEIPSSVIYIKGGAFSELGITEVIIPSSVRYIGANPFAGSGYFDSNHDYVHPKIISHSSYILVDGSCLYSLLEKTLIDCWSEDNISIRNGCENIGENAFWNAKIKHLYLPSTIINIHESAFWGFKMKLDRIQVKFEDEEHFKSIVPKPYKNLVTGLPF